VNILRHRSIRSRRMVWIPDNNYDMLKGRRMIRLFPVMAKAAEGMILLEIAKHVDLEATQFGSRRKRDVHDAMATIYKFLHANRDMYMALLSMDVEGGFDKIDMDLMAGFLVTRGCPTVIVHLVRVGTFQHTVTFQFNSRISNEFHLSRGIRHWQGSPLSLFLFRIYVADICRPRHQYSLSILTHQQKKKVTPGRTPCSLCVRRSRCMERKLAFWVCGLLLGAGGQVSMPPGPTRRNPGLRRYLTQKGSPDAKRFSGRNHIG